MQFIYNALNSIKSNEDLIAYISKGRDLTNYTEITNPYIGKENVEWKIEKCTIILRMFINMRYNFKIPLLGILQCQADGKILLKIKYPKSFVVLYFLFCSVISTVSLNSVFTNTYKVEANLINNSILIKSIVTTLIKFGVITFFTLMFYLEKKNNCSILKDGFDQIYEIAI